MIVMEFKDILVGHSESVIAIAKILRNKILSLDSDISEDVFVGDLGHQASYSIGNIHNVIAVVSPAIDHCKIYLHYFDQVNAFQLELEGKGKHSRHISLKDPNDLPRAELKRVLHEITLVAKGM